MGRTKILDRGVETEVADAIVEVLDDSGFSVEEIIPGLILALTLIAEKSRFPEECLDEATNLLADTGKF